MTPGMTAPDITIILCTLNRAAILADTLASFARMRKSARRAASVLLVDNGSTDTTAAVLHDFAAREPGVRLLLEPRRGLSLARNLGLAHVETPLVAFVDDDVDFEDGWLDAVVDSFHQQPEMDALGGRTDPRFPGPRPQWFYDRLFTWYGCSRLGEHSRWMCADAQSPREGLGSLLGALVRAHTGGLMSPRRLWWHSRVPSLPDRAHRAYLHGRLTQSMRERLRPA